MENGKRKPKRGKPKKRKTEKEENRKRGEKKNKMKMVERKRGKLQSGTFEWKWIKWSERGRLKKEKWNMENEKVKKWQIRS